ncbi:d-amino acid oxidase [Suhomyces tanzawaensis NRRL Y-17324]|uniref:D-amino acid oxidase n=1 Tax=Suhomyces tanzawaensis NRRL Y-17324 TaxID=984487 RepID=A0A1E4SMN1_9ASCO|nr:d-amino acid oxidase [Suhomyces tanzawaensis NRRL Y-17324]ODV80642.1 d-amino acid oxidase [Suhomyces tanzawaensis NRRL Y-17324]
MSEIVVVGAGVLGLSTALVLSELRGVHLTVVAQHGPHDPALNLPMSNHSAYTSPWAGAHYRPAPSRDDAEYDMAMITRLTLAQFQQWAHSHPESSIQFVDGIEYFESPDAITRGLGRGYTEQIRHFRTIEHNLPPGVVFGTRYDTWVLNPPVFLRFLYHQLEARGVTFVHKKLDSLKQVNLLVEGHPLIVNCSGNGLLYHGGHDQQVFPIRGQTLLVDPPAHCRYTHETVTHQLKDGQWTFVVPRPHNGGVILGGTKQVGDLYDGIRDEDTRAICARGAVLYPELMKVDKNGKKYFDIKRVNMAFRPARTGGLRIALERKDALQGRDNDVIHNYGAGGMGYELSYGSALRVLEKVKEVVLGLKL